VLEGDAEIFFLLETLLVAAEVVTLASLHALLDIPKTVRRTARLALNSLCRVCKSETQKGSKVAEQEAALGGDALPND
jgi:hypothetical protein